MSVVTVQLGQCGNQIGGQLFSTLMNDVKSSPKFCSKKEHEEYCQVSLERFFSEGKKQHSARAVLVDMEGKAISNTVQETKKSGTWKYQQNQQFCQKRGSGNNWAHGFCSHGPNAKEPVMEIVRREVEKCDRFGGFLCLLSLAGGTGSGVGAFITECLRDEYPHSFIVNQVVTPYNMGEVIVQNYNAVLTLSHLYRSTDAIVIMENDSLQKICSQLLSVVKISFRDINTVISHKLASILQPAFANSHQSRIPCLGDILEQMVPHPEYKLLNIKNIPQQSAVSHQFSTYQWHGLLKHLNQMLIADAPMEEGINWSIKANPRFNYNKSLSNLLVLRGKECVAEAKVDSFNQPPLYASWVPKSALFQSWYHPRGFSGYEKSATLLSNSQTPVRTLDNVIGKAWDMFSSRAYVHQYTKFGFLEDDFLDCFSTLEQVLSSYKNI